jgi:hypothetical protein
MAPGKSMIFNQLTQFIAGDFINFPAVKTSDIVTEVSLLMHSGSYMYHYIFGFVYRPLCDNVKI